LICGVAANIEAQRSSHKQRSSSAPVHKFATGSSAEGIKLELINNLVLVQARVNNSDPLWFIFDTGATNTVVDAKQAEALRLKARGKTSGPDQRRILRPGVFQTFRSSFPALKCLG
jgi:predicted aspartyl protease